MSLVAGLLCNTVKSSLLSRSSLLTLTTPIIISKRDRIFWERDKRSGKRAPLTESKTKLQHIREGFKELKVQIGVWKNEVKEHLLCDPILTHPPGNIDFKIIDNQIPITTWLLH